MNRDPRLKTVFRAGSPRDRGSDHSDSRFPCSSESLRRLPVIDRINSLIRKDQHRARWSARMSSDLSRQLGTPPKAGPTHAFFARLWLVGTIIFRHTRHFSWPETILKGRETTSNLHSNKTKHWGGSKRGFGFLANCTRKTCVTDIVRIHFSPGFQGPEAFLKPVYSENMYDEKPLVWRVFLCRCTTLFCKLRTRTTPALKPISSGLGNESRSGNKKRRPLQTPPGRSKGLSVLEDGNAVKIEGPIARYSSGRTLSR